MKYFAPNKVWLVVLSTPIFNSYLHAAVDTESVSVLAPIVTQAEVNTDITENNKKYKKEKSSQATKMNLSLRETPQPILVLPNR